MARDPCVNNPITGDGREKRNWLFGTPREFRFPTAPVGYQYEPALTSETGRRRLQGEKECRTQMMS